VVLLITSSSACLSLCASRCHIDRAVQETGIDPSFSSPVTHSRHSTPGTSASLVAPLNAEIQSDGESYSEDETATPSGSKVQKKRVRITNENAEYGIVEGPMRGDMKWSESLIHSW
jgi:hypothetical protein